MNVYEDQTVDVSTVKQWVVRFSSGGRISHHEMKNIPIRSSMQISVFHQGTVCRDEYQLQCVGNCGDSVGI